MNEFTEILQSATASIEGSYFLLRIDGGSPIPRERIYCYELYHQMRLRWPIRSPYILNGELDKRAHPILRDLGIDNVTPDFLVHTPGSMDGNFAVIEVKNTISPRGVQKDLDTLDRFVRKAGYKRAIYLLYGREATDHGLSRIKEIAAERQSLEPVEIWIHPEERKSAMHASTLCIP